MVVRCEFKTHSYPHDVIFNPRLTTVKDSYSLDWAAIATFLPNIFNAPESCMQPMKNGENAKTFDHELRMRQEVLTGIWEHSFYQKSHKLRTNGKNRACLAGLEQHTRPHKAYTDCFCATFVYPLRHSIGQVERISAKYGINQNHSHIDIMCLCASPSNGFFVPQYCI